MNTLYTTQIGLPVHRTDSIIVLVLMYTSTLPVATVQVHSTGICDWVQVIVCSRTLLSHSVNLLYADTLYRLL